MNYFVILSFIACLSSQFKLPKPFQKDFSYVPPGFVVLNEDTLSIQAFYMQNYEVTNKQYNEFLTWLEENGDETAKKQVALSTENWTSEPGMYSEQYALHYHTHEAYQDYPVVNVSHEGALLYCAYLEEKINSALQSATVKVHLPEHAEFIRAGAGDQLGAIYSWGDTHLRNTDGSLRANFIRIPQSSLTRDKEGNLISYPMPYDHFHESNESADLTAPSKSYFPSKLGFYNLNGNVAEMIAEEGIAVGGSWMDYGYDIRLQSRRTYETASTKVGFRPVFRVVANN
jgi:formylglycine-generating enzyme required for sulfatase activity